MQNKIGPASIQATGKCVAQRVRFNFWQQAVWTALGLSASDRKEMSSYEMYSSDTETWGRIPSKAISLTPGEGVIYRHVDVKKVIRLEEYVEKCRCNVNVAAPREETVVDAVGRMGAGTQEDPIVL